MFQFRRFPTLSYLIQITLTAYCTAGFPHSDISGSTLICSSPKLFAAYHVLHRLLMPRHSPCALLRLTFRRSKRRLLRFRLQRKAYGENCACSVAPPPKFEPASLGFKFVSKSVTLAYRFHFGSVFQLRKVHNWFSSSELCRLMFRSLFS